MLADLLVGVVVSIMETLTNLVNSIWGAFDTSWLGDGIMFFTRMDYYFPVATIVQVTGLLAVVATISWAYKIFVKIIDWVKPL